MKTYSTRFTTVCAAKTLLVFGLISAPLRIQAQSQQAPRPREPIARGPGAEAPAAIAKRTMPLVPPLPAGVTELKFSDFFVLPVGTRGLQLTDKLLHLDGQRVRILGCMVREEAGSPGRFLLAPFPVQLHEHDSKFADDLPPSTVHVFVPASGGQPVPYTPKLLLLTGLVSVGSREEADGRISVVRLTLDAPAGASKASKSSAIEKGAARLVKLGAVESLNR